MKHSRIGMKAPCLVLLLIGVMLVMPVGVVSAQDDTPEALFDRGAILFKQGRFISARLDFGQIISGYPDNPWVPAALMMTAKCYFSLGEYEEAESASRNLIARFPRNRFGEWAHYMIAACRFQTGHVQEAVDELAGLVSWSTDETLKARAVNALRLSILPVYDNEKVYAALESAGISRSVFDRNPEASTGLDQITSSPRQIEEASWLARDTVSIGLLVPLTGMDSDLGAELMRGVETVIKEHPTVNGRKLDLIVEDTTSDPVTALLRTRNLIQAGVIAIIGPILSEANYAPAAIAQEYGIPFIAPTTTDANFTRIGNFIFQLNFNPQVQAEALANLAGNVLGFETFAVIASGDPWGEKAANTFRSRMEEYGAENILTDYYSMDDPSNNYNLLMRIRDRAPESQSILEKIVVLDPGSLFPDTVYVKNDESPRGGKQLTPINSVECIFISAPTEQAVRLASQIMEYNINTVLLGDFGWWSNETLLRNSGQYVDGSVLVAPPGELSGGKGESFFSGSVRAGLEERISLMRGADAANILVDCLERGAADPLSIVNALARVENFRGISSRIAFDPSRHVNTAVDFVRIIDGSYRKLDLSQPEQLRRDIRFLYMQ